MPEQHVRFPERPGYPNDRRQAMVFVALLAFAAILGAVMILWALLV